MSTRKNYGGSTGSSSREFPDPGGVRVHTDQTTPNPFEPTPKKQEIASPLPIISDDGRVNFARVKKFAEIALDSINRPMDKAIRLLKEKGYTNIRYINDIETDTV